LGVKLAERPSACNEWARASAVFRVSVTLDDLRSRLGYILTFPPGFADIS